MAKVTINRQYNVAAPDSMAQRVAGRVRRRLYERFLEDCSIQPDDTILDVGATSDTTYDTSNYLEAWYPRKHKITAVGMDDAHFLEERYPGVTYRKADGRALPFADASFDVVHSSAVLEHVGSRAQQARFIGELARVARRAAFFTTPNRWFPIEVHTVIPLLHWLPPKVFRRFLATVGHDELSREENLNLLGGGDMACLCKGLGLTDYAVSSVRLLGWPSNLMLIVKK
jgi:ubiquinone/menaquinone biosynthesis C-methylase UbiE